jgi:hypothetical protein
MLDIIEAIQVRRGKRKKAESDTDGATEPEVIED